MKSRSFVLFIALCCFALTSLHAIAQSDTIPVRDEQTVKPVKDEIHRGDFGIGFGLDYGGIFGVQGAYTPFKHLTFFGALGYYIIDVGWQVGMKTPLVAKTSAKGFRPFFKAMYGVNSQIKVDGAESYDQVYKGFSVGFGVEIRGGKKKQNGIDLDINVPIRTGEFWNDYQKLKQDPNITLQNNLLPFTISIGFHHEF